MRSDFCVLGKKLQVKLSTLGSLATKTERLREPEALYMRRPSSSGFGNFQGLSTTTLPHVRYDRVPSHLGGSRALVMLLHTLSLTRGEACMGWMAARHAIGHPPAESRESK